MSAGQTPREAARKLIDVGLDASKLTDWEKSYLLNLQQSDLKPTSGVHDEVESVLTRVDEIEKEIEVSQETQLTELPPTKIDPSNTVVNKRVLVSSRLSHKDKPFTWAEALHMAQLQSYIDP